MLLKYRAATNNFRVLREDDISEPVDEGGALAAHPTHLIFSFFELGRKVMTPDFENQVEVLFVACFSCRKQGTRKTPFTKQVIGGHILHCLVRHQSDSLGQSEVCVNDFALNLGVS